MAQPEEANLMQRTWLQVGPEVAAEVVGEEEVAKSGAEGEEEEEEGAAQEETEAFDWQC